MALEKTSRNLWRLSSHVASRGGRGRVCFGRDRRRSIDSWAHAAPLDGRNLTQWGECGAAVGAPWQSRPRLSGPPGGGIIGASSGKSLQLALFSVIPSATPWDFDPSQTGPHNVREASGLKLLVPPVGLEPEVWLVVWHDGAEGSMDSFSALWFDAVVVKMAATDTLDPFQKNKIGIRGQFVTLGITNWA